jgi:hypothetical protein
LMRTMKELLVDFFEVMIDAKMWQERNLNENCTITVNVPWGKVF